LLVLLAACGGEIISGDVVRAGAPDDFSAAAATGEMATVIVGNPFAEPATRVEAAIVGAMQGHHPRARLRFTTRPGPAALPDHRIVVMFDPPRALVPRALCADVGGLRPAAAGPRLRLLAVFCAEGEVVSFVDASTAAAETADHPAVRRLIANVMEELILETDPLTIID
jgi:hypothetical protein